MKLIAVRRDDRFSPNSVEKDRLILEAACNNVCRHFEQQGEPCALRWVDEAELTTHDEADLYLSMARLPEALSILEGFEQQGRRVINSPRGVRNCQRSVLEKLMRENQLSTPLAYQEGQEEESPCWLKRGDAAAQSKDDVVFCNDAEALKKAISDFESRGISDYVISRHVEGDVVKFYGVNSHPSTEETCSDSNPTSEGANPLPFRATGVFRAATDVAAAPQRGANPAFATEGGPGRGSSSSATSTPPTTGRRSLATRPPATARLITTPSTSPPCKAKWNGWPSWWASRSTVAMPSSTARAASTSSTSTIGPAFRAVATRRQRPSAIAP